MSAQVVIRPYEAHDRQALREIACDTADQGKPVENFFSDRQVFADLLTLYYTDYEPDSVWVAECERKVIGYLSGCLDSHRYTRVMTWSIMPKIVMCAFIRGVFFKIQTWRILIAMFKSWKGGGFNRGDILRDHPAHLHLNVIGSFRGQGIGQGLVARFKAKVEREGRTGIHICVRGDSIASRKFFEKMGFILLNTYPMVMPEGDSYRKNYTAVYGMLMHHL